MRLLSASGFVAVALLAGGCASRGMNPAEPANDVIVQKLKSLGIEGRTYVNDLGQAAPTHVHAVHQVEDDFLLEDLFGNLTYVDGATLNTDWFFADLPAKFDAPPDSTPTSIVGLADGKLFVLARHNGTVTVPPRRVKVVPSATPVSTDSTLYVPTYATPGSAKSLQSVSLGSGYIGWGVRTPSEITANLAKGGPGGGDSVYAATTDGSLYAYPTEQASAGTPSAAWTAHAKAPVFFDLALDGDDLGVVTADARLLCIDRITGHVRWERYPKVPGERPEGAAQFSSSLAFYRVNGELRAIDRATGEQVWALAGGTTFLAERDDFLIISGAGGWVMQVETKTGKMLAKERLAGMTIPTHIAPNTTFHCVTDEGLMVGVEYGW